MSRERTWSPLDFFDFLMSAVYDGSLDPGHRDDLKASALSDEMIERQRFRSVPPDMLERLLGYSVPRAVRSMLLIPYFDIEGHLIPHIRVKLFPPITDGEDGHTVKYLQLRGSSPRLFIPCAARESILRDDVPLLITEGEKKALSVAQGGYAAVGIAGVEGWHIKGSRKLLDDFQQIPLMGRLVELLPDSDYRSNRAVESAVGGLATALGAAGARMRVIVLPETLPT